MATRLLRWDPKWMRFVAAAVAVAVASALAVAAALAARHRTP